MNNQSQLIDHLFRHESGKMVAVLTKLFGFQQLEVAEDLVQDTFVMAAQSWLAQVPDNPSAWLYKVAKNKALDYVRRQKKFQTIAAEIVTAIPIEYSINAQLEAAFQSIKDSQLQMLFAICHSAIPIEAQVALALKTLCGFSIDEIARAFLTNKENINKRLFRAKEKIRKEGLQLEFPDATQLTASIDSVLQCIYLLFNEGYYSSSQEVLIRKDLCLEAARLCLLLLETTPTNQPPVNALMSLMCFHMSRFESRLDEDGGIVLWQEQNRTLWNVALIEKGEFYLNAAAFGETVSTYHLEAMIAYYHTQPDDDNKWRALLQLYDQLLLANENPVVQLNRAYVLSKTQSPEAAIADLEGLSIFHQHHLYHALLGKLYEYIDINRALEHWQRALDLAPLALEQTFIREKIAALGRVE